MVVPNCQLSHLFAFGVSILSMIQIKIISVYSRYAYVQGRSDLTTCYVVFQRILNGMLVSQ